MNSANMDFKEGDKVVLKKGIMKPKFQSLEWRTVTLTGGFGMSSYTGGTALFVKFKDGDESRFSGMDIDPVETRKLLSK